MCEELKFSKKVTLKTIEKNKESFENEVEKDLLNFLKESYIGLDYLILLKKVYFGNYDIKDFECIICKKPVKADRKNTKTCGMESCKRKSYASQQGKKRPKHSKKMVKIIKEKIENGEMWGESHRKNNLKHINSIKMKRKELINKGIINDNGNCSDVEIMELLSQERRRAKSSDVRLKQELNSFLKNETYIGSEFFSDTEFKSMSFDNKIKYKNSIISKVAKTNNPNMGGYGFAGGFFKGSLLKGLLYNNRKLSLVETKSSYETNFINFFESNGIIWDYEPEIIFIKKDCFSRKTIPDFYLYENNVLSKVIEVKGYIENYDEMVEKVFETTKYYEAQHIPYYFCKISHIKDIEEIEEWNCFGKTKKEIKEIVYKGKK